jgi:hypothetical protein
MAADAKTEEQRLLLKPPGAAATLEISERQLWGKTQPRGPIPCVRIGNCVRYSPQALKAFIASQQLEGGAK